MKLLEALCRTSEIQHPSGCMVKGGEGHQFICSNPGLYKAHPFAVFPQGKGKGADILPCVSRTLLQLESKSLHSDHWNFRKKHEFREFFYPSHFWSLSWQTATKQSQKRSLRDASRITESPNKCHPLDQVAQGPIQSDTNAYLHHFGSLCLHALFPIPSLPQCHICGWTGAVWLGCCSRDRAGLCAAQDPLVIDQGRQ